MIEILHTVCGQVKQQDKPTKLVSTLLTAMGLFIEFKGENKKRNLSFKDITTIKSLIKAQSNEWDDGIFTEYFQNYYKDIINKLRNLTNFEQISKLLSEGSLYFQLMSLAMQDKGIYEAMKGAITSQEEFNLWKDKLLNQSLEEQIRSEVDASSNKSFAKTDIIQQLNKWLKSNNFSSEVSDSTNIVDRLSFNDCLISLLSDEGFYAFSEQGCPPEEYLQSLIYGYLNLIDDKEITLEKIEPIGDWEQAKIILSNSDNKFELTIEGIDGSDWVPVDLGEKLKRFSQEHLNKILYTVYGEDPFIVVYLTSDAISALNDIRNILPENDF